ncbi:hypothetical protein DACRYDRAFT_115969 [Dacryopinax primogenitus]|uniref:Uncharacterized protein n=1 Tax=Dacryopinax primogenitus (strain DJM 731) TaxID=1858805 RepID=M5FWD7_DACPD|nr:uncharacterized protein DACRYDRAFT_115969 [Dacryopinax primogenitus]EJU02226.1 hypothetical protein DACRYDRAFT_115969 [Dacryopinax primogenitus]
MANDLEDTGMYVVSVKEQEEVTVKSWASEYEGNGVELFHKHITDCCEMCQGPGSSIYAKTVVIVNSSGMGKTRMIDESSKSLFTVLFVLRDTAGGFPPSDSDVLAYFQSPRTMEDCQTAILCFLKTLYDNLADMLKKQTEKMEKRKHAEIAHWFRGYLGSWDQMGAPSQERKRFFESVVNGANNMLQAQGAMPDPTFTGGRDAAGLSPRLPATDLSYQSQMIRSFQTLSELLSHEHPGHLPTVLLAFDEAHTLLRPIDKQDRRTTIHTVLRRVFRSLNNERHMACFLSTSASITQFAAPMRLDPSSRIQWDIYHTLPAFSSFPLNMARIQPHEMDLTAVGKIDFMCKQSRILFRTRAEHGVHNEVGRNLVRFAKDKLLGASDTSEYDDAQNLAILARRIPIDIRTNTSSALTSTNQQIAQHMRVLYKIKDKNESLITGSPSEPSISEGAKSAMSSGSFDAAIALRRILGSPGISVGERGEMVVELLMILASDAATKHGKFSIPDFFQNLLTEDSWKTLRSSKASRGGELHNKPFKSTFQTLLGTSTT